MSPFAVAREEWQVLQAARPNALLIGSDAAIASVLDQLTRTCRPPIACSTSSDLVLPDIDDGTLVVKDVGLLTPERQEELLQWLGTGERSVQTIATSPFALWPLVERSEFLDRLYYRLNIVTVCLESS
jgi:hypothetical protein